MSFTESGACRPLFGEDRNRGRHESESWTNLPECATHKIHSDYVIYSPEVVIIRDDDSNLLDLPYKVDYLEYARSAQL
jgi:hypothetical protein